MQPLPPGAGLLAKRMVTIWRREQQVRQRGTLTIGMAALLVAAIGPGGASAQDQVPPYWASIDATRAIMRRGPSQEMRAMWEYRRQGLPLKVLRLHDDWRLVREPDGTTGWMHRSLITGRRTAIVTESETPLRAAPDAGAPVAYRAERGVVGRISDCTPGWCLFDVLGRRGYVARDAVWGDDGD